jgi:hypothetical protein
MNLQLDGEHISTVAQIDSIFIDRNGRCLSLDPVPVSGTWAH